MLILVRKKNPFTKTATPGGISQNHGRLPSKAVINNQDYVSALTWLMWAFLWFLFFALNAWGKPLEQFTSKVAFVQSWVTLTIPSLLYFIGVWSDELVQLIWLIVLSLSALYFIYEALKIKKAIA